nr:AAA family ATPase [Nitrosomonas communis]
MSSGEQKESVNQDKFDQLAQKCAALQSDMHFRHIYDTPVIEFSNTGRRGDKKYFVITLRALRQTLIDIRNNLAVFEKIQSYVETPWRDAFSEYITDEATNALSTVQTLPLFSVIGKVIHVTNNLPRDEYQDKVASLKKEYLDHTIECLSSQIPDEEQIKSKKSDSTPSVTHAVNRIYYGAPGTGKSFAIDREINHERSFRIVFHADTQYTDFIGCLKPVVEEEGLSYAFRPGPFTNALLEAIQNNGKHFWLVIEEINRAPAAAVFGEIFQLLDRTDTGESRYGITPSDPELVKYMERELGAKMGSFQIKIPSNLSILATMNSSDQAVMPMDTAFKRRWEFRYIPLNFDVCANGSFNLHQSGTSYTVSWKDFALTINKILSDLGIPEDRHLGPFFLNDRELAGDEPSSKALTGKLFKSAHNRGVCSEPSSPIVKVVKREANVSATMSVLPSEVITLPFGKIKPLAVILQ